MTRRNDGREPRMIEDTMADVYDRLNPSVARAAPPPTAALPAFRHRTPRKPRSRTTHATTGGSSRRVLSSTTTRAARDR